MKNLICITKLIVASVLCLMVAVFFLRQVNNKDRDRQLSDPFYYMGQQGYGNVAGWSMSEDNRPTYHSDTTEWDKAFIEAVKKADAHKRYMRSYWHDFFAVCSGLLFFIFAGGFTLSGLAALICILPIPTETK